LIKLRTDCSDHWENERQNNQSDHANTAAIAASQEDEYRQRPSKSLRDAVCV
jgi:hypothetical protein